jgi:hypothetical protein
VTDSLLAELTTADQVAELLQMRRSTVEDYARRGLLPSLPTLIDFELDRLVEPSAGDGVQSGAAMEARRLQLPLASWSRRLNANACSSPETSVPSASPEATACIRTR